MKRRIFWEWYGKSAGKSKGQKGGGMMDIVMGFIIGTFAGSIVVTFTLCLFFVNAKRRDE